VIFSADRVRAKGSNFTTVIPTDAKFIKVDDHTVDVVLSSPNPILITQWDGWYIMDKKWCEDNNAVAPTPASATTPSYASLHEDGTARSSSRAINPASRPCSRSTPTGGASPNII